MRGLTLIALMLAAVMAGAQAVIPQMPPDTPAPAHPAPRPTQPSSSLPQSDGSQQPAAQPQASPSQRPPMPVQSGPGISAPAQAVANPHPRTGMAAPAGARQAATRRKKAPLKHGIVTPPTPPQAIVTPPAPPPTLEQSPPNPPTVTYRDGKLSVTAENSRLSDVLQAVRQATGASVDVPPSAQAERVVFRAGPASPRDVLTALLNGSKFNYVIVGTPADPGSVRRLIVSPRSDASGSFAGAAPGQPVVTPRAEDRDEDEAPRAVAPSQPQPAPFPGIAPAQPPSQPPQPAVVLPSPDRNPPEVQAPSTGQSPTGQSPTNQPQIKTPEQLLDELKRLQQQQQQQKPPK